MATKILARYPVIVSLSDVPKSFEREVKSREGDFVHQRRQGKETLSLCFPGMPFSPSESRKNAMLCYAVKKVLEGEWLVAG